MHEDCGFGGIVVDRRVSCVVIVVAVNVVVANEEIAEDDVVVVVDVDGVVVGQGTGLEHARAVVASASKSHRAPPLDAR